jgi:hypothetical protein
MSGKIVIILKFIGNRERGDMKKSKVGKKSKKSKKGIAENPSFPPYPSSPSYPDLKPFLPTLLFFPFLLNYIIVDQKNPTSAGFFNKLFLD